jgi:hypothetical protein
VTVTDTNDPVPGLRHGAGADDRAITGHLTDAVTPDLDEPRDTAARDEEALMNDTRRAVTGTTARPS